MHGFGVQSCYGQHLGVRDEEEIAQLLLSGSVDQLLDAVQVERGRVRLKSCIPVIDVAIQSDALVALFVCRRLLKRVDAGYVFVSEILLVFDDIVQFLQFEPGFLAQLDLGVDCPAVADEQQKADKWQEVLHNKVV